MIKTTFAILFSMLLICSFIFASCNANQPIFSQDSNTDSSADTTTALYTTMIQDLENQIVALQQNQYISDAESKQEITRLQNLLSELKGQLGNSDSQDSSTNTPENPSNQTEAPTVLHTRDGDTATITGYTGKDERLVIPSSIDGYTVTAIADSAFSSDTLKSVVIPDGVVTLGWFAFFECAALTSVTIPDSVTEIGYSAFPSTLSAFTIYCHSNSFAQKYAASYGLSYAII